MIPALAQEIRRKTSSWQTETRGRLRDLLEHLTMTVGVPGVAQVEAAWARQPAVATQGVREFEDVVRETAASAGREGRPGVVFFIDEIQSADRDGLRTLGYAWQHLQSEGSDIPAAVFAAGLPNSPEAIAAVVTFSERFAYRPLERLAPEAVMIALTGPARALGVEWDQGALEDAVAVAQGYPYSVQLIGDTTWAAAGYPDVGTTLTRVHLQQGQQAMRTDLDALFRARWEKATAVEQDFMQAMASLGDGPVRRSDIARTLTATSDELSVPRARLIDKGLIDVAGRGQLEFTIPGFAEYVRTRTDSATT